MKSSTDRILTTHTGALHRPPDLEELYRQKFAGEPVDERALEARLKTAVAEIVRRQASIGVDVIDDGEMSKLSFWAYARSRLDGVVAQPLSATKDAFFRRAGQTASSAGDRERFAQFYADTEGPNGVTTPPNVIQMYIPAGTAYEPPANHVVEGPVKYKADEVRTDIATFKQALEGVPHVEAFLPVVAPGMLATRYRNDYYKSEEEYYFAIADALHEEYRAVTDAGFVLQIDDVSLPGRRRLLPGESGKAAFDKWAGLAVDALNHALRGIAPERVRYHMCWSSMNAPHTDDPPLAELVHCLFKINAQGYQIEAANVRHEHEYHLWETTRLPDGKILMPGVICHATNVIEHPDYVAERILRYANAVGRANVIAATDCGFRSRVHPQIAWAKLETLVEGARLASAKLWPGG
ncbi:MAG TPA: cobalamin-independent methionine synthase II family protein [Stellaceae bacterium]|nr:cobalamin-independent methionine synthase II family protein [Stellaceae bacterium]